MTRYFFNVHDGVDIEDDVGSEFDSLDAVRLEALRTAGELLKFGGRADLWSGHEWRLVVKDEAGNRVLTLKFAAELDDAPELASSRPLRTASA